MFAAQPVWDCDAAGPHAPVVTAKDGTALYLSDRRRGVYYTKAQYEALQRGEGEPGEGQLVDRCTASGTASLADDWAINPATGLEVEGVLARLQHGLHPLSRCLRLHPHCQSSPHTA